MWIVFQADSSHEMSTLIFYDNLKKLEMCPKETDAPTWKT